MTGHSLELHWVPSLEDRHYGRELGLTEADILGMAEDMRCWAYANANRQVARKSSWSMAFRGWMRREAAKQGKARNGTANPTMGAFDRIIAAAKMGPGGDKGPLLDLTATSSGVRQAIGGTVAARQPAESGDLFPVDRKNT
jgi:hypothetical protein